MTSDEFWTRVFACDKAERIFGPPMHVVRPLVVLSPGAPMMLLLSDGREFAGGDRESLVEAAERASRP